MEERTQLGLLVSQKLSQRQIATQLGRSAREVYTEIVQAKLAERQALAAKTVALQT